jgi:hypothetical protein
MKPNRKVRIFDRALASKKIDMLASAKDELIKIQKQIFEEQLAFQRVEQKLKLEEHKLKIESLKLDIKI